MKLEEVLPAFREGKSIRLKDHSYIFHKTNALSCAFTYKLYELTSDNWEIVEEKRELTLNNIRQAWIRANGLNHRSWPDDFINFIKELGFKNGA